MDCHVGNCYTRVQVREVCTGTRLERIVCMVGAIPLIVVSAIGVFEVVEVAGG